MKEFIQNYTNPNEDRMNYGLINNEYDEDLVYHIVNVYKSLEVLKNVSFLGYTYTEDESKIDLSFYNRSTRKKKQKTKKEEPKYINIHDGRYGELEARFLLRLWNEKKPITVKILIPLTDSDGYYTINGKKYFMLYQLVESSTYTTKQNLVLKSLMPVSMKRVSATYADTTNSEYIAPLYKVYVFKEEINVLLFYLAKLGFKQTMKYFSLNSIIDVREDIRDEEKYIYFKRGNVYIEVNRYFFNKYQYVRSITFMLADLFLPKKIEMSCLENKDYWITMVGSFFSKQVYNHYEKGLNQMIFFDRMIDITTKEILKVHPENKKNIYAIIRWMIQNYNELRMKDNMDLDNKRLRRNEYIASLLTKMFSDKINRIFSGKKKTITMNKLKDLFKIPGNVIVNELIKTGLLRYDKYLSTMSVMA